MAVLAYTAHEEVDSACSLDLLLVGRALGCEILRVAVEDVDVLLRYVHVVEEVPCHERVVAFRMLLWKSHIFVHVERDHILE